MFKRLAVAAAFVLAVLPLGAQAVPYGSDQYNFAANFPEAPSVGQPQGSEKDDKGNFISTLMMFQNQKQGVYFCAVMVDSFDIVTTIDVNGSITNERDAFLQPLKATVVSANQGQLDGHPAGFFTWTTPDGSASGGGFVAIVTADKPRIYMAVTMHTGRATADDIAALDAFLSSVHITK